MTGTETEALDIRIKGRIQGVGFRPFIYRLASRYNLHGWVNNQTSHVKIHIEGSKENNRLFIRDISLKAPPVSSIDSLETTAASFHKYKNFSIIPSIDSSDSVTEISPDIAACTDCLEDIESAPRRVNYPFTNCTNCGPRFSIIEALPYDRPNTTMKDFEMCPDCQKEYDSPDNRRFHAQPNSCSDCGPVYTMHTTDKIILDINEILTETVNILQSGGIAAIKGIGGFHLVCSPFDKNAVARLRKLKKRDCKPFAVMFRSVREIKKYAEVSNCEEKSLTSVRSPIVILKLKEGNSFLPGVTSGLKSIGCFLPYTPFHHILLQNPSIPALVMTSGNISATPIIIDNKTALDQFFPGCDCVLTYNREIKNRTDDSVVKIINGKERVFRRSRGWAPESVLVSINVEGIAAAGGEQKNCFCIGRENRAILSQHIGNVRNIETLGFYKESFNRYSNLYRLSPSLIARDLHPDYMTTRFFTDQDLPKSEIQHHHAHIASCMAENGIDEKVIGFSFDGTGLGDDGNIWGGEVFICNLADYKREFHFKYLPLPGGDAAVSEPWRMGVSLLYGTFGESFTSLDLPFLKQIPRKSMDTVLGMIDRKINSPLTSSLGRIFDAVSAISGLCSYSSFDAEAPMLLEDLLFPEPPSREYYPFLIDKDIDISGSVQKIVIDLLKGESVSRVSLKFHNTVIEIICRTAEHLRNSTGINRVILSGGVFMNGYLLTNGENRLRALNFEVFTHSQVPSNDGGLALGQLVIAAKRREQKGDM